MRKSFSVRRSLIESRIRRILLENIVDELRSILVGIDGDKGAQLAGRFVAAVARASERKMDKEIPDWEQKRNAGYWKGLISREPSTAEDLEDWVSAVEQILMMPTQRTLKDDFGRVAKAASLVFPSVNGKDYRIIFKFAHETAVKTSRDLGGSKLCTASEESCIHFDDYSASGVLVTLTAIPGESQDEREKQHPGSTGHEKFKPSSLNVQLVLNLSDALYGPSSEDLDPAAARYGEVMWYDDAKFLKPDVNLEQLYGVTPELLASFLKSNDERTTVFREHIFEIMEEMEPTASKKKLRSKLKLPEHPHDEWLNQWLQEIEKSGFVRNMPSDEMIINLDGRVRNEIRKALSNKKFVGVRVSGELGMLDFDGGDIFGANFKNCSFGRTFEYERSAAYKKCTFTNCSFDENFIARLEKCNFMGCNMQGLGFAKTEFALLVQSQFERCNLRNTIFGRNDLEGTTFRSCDLSSADFGESRMSGVTIENCNTNNIFFPRGFEYLGESRARLKVRASHLKKLVTEALHTYAR